ncbi:aromatic ring-hydroxylating oxygenase subunit alpha [Nocardia sp. alder85J]|uniref:aromatic ring-hydroxylating oxygenase subunit alpha n=1 Tax=Nocardia sp. alder85J TaxID=2862949 RepID=UPI001CD79378|nr:aromatic ring-hydroxylating dioxygenase subunit alpha [Nocardia sp. alder85J]MCX4094653.1 aromatic ring-hydroxylating dioxygenase subunit alpha [Nocardia sp. alder85J]
MTNVTRTTRILSGPLPEHPAGTAILSGAHYTDAGLFTAEQRRVFERGWVWSGFEHWLTEPGTVHPVEVAGRPLLLIRGHDDRIRVFHNACRHRGMALVVDQPITVTGRLRCDYHCWTYDLDGALATAPLYRRGRDGRVDEADRRRLGLLEVPSRCWAGMIFVDLADRARPFEDDLGPLLRRWAPVDFARLHLAGERRFDVGANWKLVVENFLDFYHLPFIHPQVGPVTAALDVDDLVLGETILGAEYPCGAVGKAAKTAAPLPFFAGIPAQRARGQDLFCVFPNTLLILEGDWLQVIGFQPVSPTRTVEHMAVFVDRAAAGPEFADARNQLCDSLFHINEQDLPILAKLQAGRRSPGSDATALAPQWDQVTALFQHLVAQRLTDTAADRSGRGSVGDRR